MKKQPSPAVNFPAAIRPVCLLSGMMPDALHTFRIIELIFHCTLYFLPLFFGTSHKSNFQTRFTVDTNSYKTFSATPDDIDKQWVLFDADGQTLGRLASNIAIYLRGKHKPEFTPHMDTGDNVIVVNAEKIKLTGKKLQNKQYFRHTGYPGGERFTTAEEMMEKDPTFPLKNAVKGMLPKNRLSRKLLTNLRVYAGPVHPHEAQQPEKIDI